MHIEYQINEDDYVIASRLAVRKRAWYGSFIYYFFPILGLLSGVIIAMPGPQGTGKGTLIFAVVWALLIGLFPFFALPFRLRRNYRQMPVFQERRSLDTDDLYLTSTSKSLDSRATWDTYSKFAENQATFVLFMKGNRLFVPIPKREMSPAEIEQLRSIFKTHMPAT